MTDIAHNPLPPSSAASRERVRELSTTTRTTLGPVKSEGNHETASLRQILVSGDVVAAGLAWTIPFVLHGSLLWKLLRAPSVPRLAIAAGLIAGGTCITLAVAAAHRLYLSRVCSMRTVEAARLGRASLVIGAVALVGGKLAGESHMARTPTLVAFFTFVFLNAWRMAYGTWLNAARKSGRYTRSVLLVGANDDAQSLYKLFKAHPELGYRAVGVVGKTADMESHDFGDTPFLGETVNLRHILQTADVNGAFVSGGALSRRTLNSTIRLLLDHNVHVQLSTGINGIDHRRMRSQSLAYEPMLYVEPAHLESWQIATKRVMDIAVASFVLLLTSPILALCALLVKRHDGGPVLFRQERVGRHGKLFQIFKFRSMCTDAETKLAELQTHNVRQGPLFKMARDPRITPIGRLLRATSLDELPQLLNVIRGDMSLVGPRPALPKEVEKFNAELMARQDVMPGITGLWQVEGRDNPDFALYQRLDLFYVENWSVALDWSILFGTGKVVIARAAKAFCRQRGRRTGADRTAVVLD